MSTLKRDLKIALLLGGPGAEREVSLVSGKSVYGALRQAGFTDVTEVDVHGPDFRLPEGTELAYNIIHGTFGEDGALQAILEERGVPYTGAGSRSSALCFDKSESKKVFLEAGVPTPRAEILDCSGGIVMPSFPFPSSSSPLRGLQRGRPHRPQAGRRAPRHGGSRYPRHHRAGGGIHSRP